MNIRELEYLIAVADHKNFTEAARVCHVGQPTLSTQIKKLEQHLGIQIFERNNKKVLVSEEGQSIIHHARIIIQNINRIYDLAEESQNTLGGKLKLGAFPTIASYIFPDIVSTVRDSLPDLKLYLIEEKTDDLLQFLKDGTIDCAILALPLESNDLEYTTLFNDDFYLAVGSNHRLSKESEISIKELSTEKLMLLTEGHCLRSQSLEICKTNKIDEMTDFQATSLETLKQMVRVNSGITLVPESAISPDEQDIQYIPFQEQNLQRSIVMAWNKVSSKKEIINLIVKNFSLA